MSALSDPQLVARPDLDAKAQSDLYDLFRVGSMMFEQPTIRRTYRLASAAAKAIAGCVDGLAAPSNMRAPLLTVGGHSAEIRSGDETADPDSRLNLHIAVRARAALRHGLR